MLGDQITGRGFVSLPCPFLGNPMPFRWQYQIAIAHSHLRAEMLLDGHLNLMRLLLRAIIDIFCGVQWPSLLISRLVQAPD